MKLSKETKDLIIQEYNGFKDQMYAGKTKEERDELAQFFTPPEISIRLIEAYNVKSLAGKIIRDPTSGSGNLLAACLIAGADSDKVFGNDYDPTMVKVCRNRLNNVCDMLGKPHIRDWQVHRGDARDPFCLTEFGPDYKEALEQHFLQEDDPLGIFGVSDEHREFLTEVD